MFHLWYHSPDSPSKSVQKEILEPRKKEIKKPLKNNRVSVSEEELAEHNVTATIGDLDIPFFLDTGTQRSSSYQSRSSQLL